MFGIENQNQNTHTHKKKQTHKDIIIKQDGRKELLFFFSLSASEKR